MLQATLALGAYPNPVDIKFELDRSPYGQRVALGTATLEATQHGDDLHRPSTWR